MASPCRSRAPRRDRSSRSLALTSMILSLAVAVLGQVGDPAPQPGLRRFLLPPGLLSPLCLASQPLLQLRGGPLLRYQDNALVLPAAAVQPARRVGDEPPFLAEPVLALLLAGQG